MPSSGLAATPAAQRSPSPVLSPGEQSNARAKEDADTLLQASPITPAAGSSVSTPPIELATPLEDDEDRLDAYHDAEPLRYREGNKSCTLGLCGAAASPFCCSMQWVCAAPRGQHLGLLFSLLGQLQLVGQQQLASTFLGQQEHLRLGS